LGIPIQNSQTWPIRSDDSYAKRLEDPKNPNIRPAAYVQRDWAEWLRQVSNPEVRNLYIASHMTESSIGELGVDELNAWIHHRFRFVFLDGCRSGKGALFEAFGMRGDERVGPVAREYYTGGGWLVGDKVFVDSEKRRPAVFLGYGVAHSWYKPFENIDWTSSFPTVGEIPQQVGRFLKAFLDGMVIYGRNVRDALEEARNQSNGSNLMCWDGNRMLTWNPGRCMVVCGYEEMRMSGTQDCFNWAGQWPLP
jgi:hypothetical protein